MLNQHIIDQQEIGGLSDHRRTVQRCKHVRRRCLVVASHLLTRLQAVLASE